MVQPKEEPKLTAPALNAFLGGLHDALDKSKLTPKYQQSLLSDMVEELFPVEGVRDSGDRLTMLARDKRVPETMTELRETLARSMTLIRDYDPNVTERVEKLELKKVFNSALKAAEQAMGQSGPSR